MAEDIRVNEVSLREITRETVRTICNLHVSETQKQFVAPNAVSIAEAHFTKEAWFRAIYAGEVPVGFVVLWENHVKGRYHLWRFMIDENSQGRGYGRKALNLIIQRVRQNPKAKELRLTYCKGDGSPHQFYEKMGFADTREIIDGEYEMKLVP
jgi:diamine N-acetyltransferase